MEQKPLLASDEASEDEVTYDRKRFPEPSSVKKGGYVFSFKELYELIKNGNLQRLKVAMNERNIQLSDSRGFTLLHVASAVNDEEVLRMILSNKRCSTLLDRQDIMGATPLITALQCSSLKTLEVLCSWGADPTKALFKTGETVLHLAALQGESAAAQIMLKYYSFPEFINYLDNAGDTALIKAVRMKSPVFDILLQAGADITIQNPESGRTLLHVVIAYNRLLTLKTIMQHPAASAKFAEVKDSQGDSALMIAVRLQNMELIKLLTNTFRDLNGINMIGHESVLHIATLHNRPDILKHLLVTTSHTSIDYLDLAFRTPLMYAAELDRASCLQELIESGANIHLVKATTLETMLHIIAKSHSNSCLLFVMKLDYISWFFNQKDIEGNTPYMTAIKYGNDSFLRESFKVKYVDLSGFNNEGETVTYYAVKQGFLQVLFALMLSPKYYAFVNRKQDILDLNRSEEILKAEIRGDIYATDVYILIKKFIQLSLTQWFPPHFLVKTKLNQNVFHAVALSGSLECLEFLYEFYRLFAPKYCMEEFDRPSKSMNTPLLMAAQCGVGSIPLVNFFVNHGADLAATNTEGLNVIRAILLYNPNANHLFTYLFDNCVSAKREHYNSDKMNIRIDFRKLCSKSHSQIQIASIMFKEAKEKKLLLHPVIIAFLRIKIRRGYKGLLFTRLVASYFITLMISILIPLLYIVNGNPDEMYGLPLAIGMRAMFLVCFGACIFIVCLKIPHIIRGELWFTDAVALIRPATMITLLAFGKSFSFVPELSATTILSSWTCSIVFTVNVYPTLTYQIAVFFRLLKNISKHMIVLIAIILTFALSFSCLYKSDKRFSTVRLSFIYVFSVMLPGYLSDLPTFSEDHFSNIQNLLYFTIECLVIGSFIVVASTGFVNMLVGLAVRGRTLEIDGEIFQNYHKTHIISEVEYWSNTKFINAIKTKLFFKCLADLLQVKTVMYPLMIDVYDDHYKEIMDNRIVSEFRSILFRRIKVGKGAEQGNVASQSPEDAFRDHFCHLPCSK